MSVIHASLEVGSLLEAVRLVMILNVIPAMIMANVQNVHLVTFYPAPPVWLVTMMVVVYVKKLALENVKNAKPTIILRVTQKYLVNLVVLVTMLLLAQKPPLIVSVSFNLFFFPYLSKNVRMVVIHVLEVEKEHVPLVKLIFIWTPKQILVLLAQREHFQLLVQLNVQVNLFFNILS